MSVKKDAERFVDSTRSMWGELLAAFMAGRKAKKDSNPCKVYYIANQSGIIAEQWLVDEVTGEVLLKIKIELGKEGETINEGSAKNATIQ